MGKRKKKIKLTYIYAHFVEHIGKGLEKRIQQKPSAVQWQARSIDLEVLDRKKTASDAKENWAVWTAKSAEA